MDSFNKAKNAVSISISVTVSKAVRSSNSSAREFSPSSPWRRNSFAFPLPTLAASPSRASPCDQRGIPPWNPRLICCINQRKFAYSSARSPPRQTVPARLRMASSSADLTENASRFWKCLRKRLIWIILVSSFEDKKREGILRFLPFISFYSYS